MTDNEHGLRDDVYFEDVIAYQTSVESPKKKPCKKIHQTIIANLTQSNTMLGQIQP